MDNKTLLRTSYLDLKDRIAMLCHDLEQSDLIEARIYLYPEYELDDIGKQPEMIPLAPIEGPKALALSLEHLRRHTVPKSRQGRLVSRLPGTLVLHAPDDNALYQRILDINARKDAFSRQIVGLSKDKNERFQLVSEACPDLIKKQATRHILFAVRPLASISFAWSHRHSTSKMTKTQVLARLEKTAEYYVKRPLDATMASLVADEIKRIDGYPGTTAFRIQRPLRVAPMMNLFYQEHSEPFIRGIRAPKTMIAHSPLLIINQHPKINPFKSYVAPEHDTTRIEHDRTLVIPRLHLYAEN